MVGSISGYGGCCGYYYNPFAPNPYVANENIFSGFNMFGNCNAWNQSYNFPRIDYENMFYATEYARLDARQKQIDDLINDSDVAPQIKDYYSAENKQINAYRDYLNTARTNPQQQRPQQYVGKTWKDVGVEEDSDLAKKYEKAGLTPEMYEQITKSKQQPQPQTQTPPTTAAPTTAQTQEPEQQAAK